MNITKNKKSSRYNSILGEVRDWRLEDQRRLLQDLSHMVESPEREMVHTRPHETTIQKLRQSVAGRDYPAPRIHSAKAATGIIAMKNPLFSLSEEKEILIEALLEKYG